MGRSLVRSRHRWIALLAALMLVVSVIVVAPGFMSPTQAGPTPIETYLVPLPEADIREGSLGLYAGTSDTIRTIISITGAVDGTLVYYDHWEDGFELDLSEPVQATSEVWGDGSFANGAPPGCSADACDVFGAGDNAALINDVFANPRSAATVRYDGGDRFGATSPVAVTRAGWALDPGTLLAGAVEVYPVDAWGTRYDIPMGIDSSLGQTVEYTAVSVMAGANGTTVSIDVDADGAVDETHSLDAGESVLVPDLSEGAVVTANGPIQADLLTGDVGATYEGRWFALLPTSQWATSYYNPVGTVVADDPATVILFNPGASTLSVSVDYQGGSTAVNVPAGGTATYQMPASGARFRAGSPFYATVAIDFDGTTHDWGFTLIPESRLSTAAVVGWGPGSDNPAAENSSPVWVTAESATTLFVDYDGDPTTGAFEHTPGGDRYDQQIALPAFGSVRVRDSSDNDQTGLRVYTLDGTRITAAYGQDPSNASGGSPALDLGTAVVPLVLVSMAKAGSLAGDTNGNGALDAGEFIRYIVTIRNDGTANIDPALFTDDLDPNTTYLPDSTTLDGVPYPDDGVTTPFPFDEGGQDFGPIVPGRLMVITYDVQLSDPLPDGVDSIVNNAALNGNNISIEGTATLPVFDPFVDVTKTSDAPATGVLAGDTITYTILVENTSEVPQDGFTVADVVPLGTSYVAESTSVTGPVKATETYRDDFESGGYGGSTGSRFWGPNWQEINESDGPSSGDERIVNVGGSLRLRVRDNDGGGEGVSRAVNLAGYDTATISFDYARSGFDNIDDFVVLEATDGGGTWDELQRWVGPGSDPVFVPTNRSLDGYLTAGAAIRFVTSSSLGGSDQFFIDNLVVAASTIDVETRTNQATDPNPLVDGVAPDLVVPADPFSLDPAESMTVSFQVTVDDPLPDGIVELTNTAYVASAQQPTFTTDSVTDPIAFPDITLSKTQSANADEDASGDVSVGDTLTYQFVATNSGATDLTGVTITDPMPGLSALTCTPVAGSTLTPAESMTCTATYTVTPTDANNGRIDNTATADGVDPGGATISDTDSVTVPINRIPAITIVKSLLTNPAGLGVGDSLVYEFVVTNTGNVDLANVSVTDPLVGGAVSCPQTTLTPGGSMTCAAGHTVSQGDIDTGQIPNEASVTADDPDGGTVDDTDDELVILEQNPSIHLTKALAANADEDASGGVTLGDTLTYQFVATNDGNVTLNNVLVTDPLAGLSPLSCVPAVGSSLAPGDAMTCTATYVVTQPDVDAGSIDNTADVAGTSATGVTVSDTATESVSTSQNPSITITKSFQANADEDGSGTVSLNDTLTYGFDVVNDGNVTLTVVTIVDPMPGLSPLDCGADVLPAILTPGATLACTATYVVTPADVTNGQIDNVATASGLQPDGTPISDDDTETVFPDRNPSIDLTKALLSNADEDTSGDVSLGDTLTYQFVAANDGDVDLDNVTISDPLPGLSPLTCSPAMGSSLAPGESMTCTATIAVSQAAVDAGQIENTATAVGDDSGGTGSVSDLDSVTLTVPQNPSISLTKSYAGNADEDGSGDITVGDTLAYEFIVENTGDVTLDSVTLTDPLTGGVVSCPQTVLAPGATMTCSATYSVAQGDVDAGSIDNSSTVTADDPTGNPVGDGDDESVALSQNPSISLVKSLLANADEDGSSNVSLGDTLTYRFVATNDGDVTLSLVAVADPLPGLSPLTCAPVAGSSLAPGATMSCTATLVVTQGHVDSGSIDNTATVTGERPGGDPGNPGDDISDSDDLSVMIPPEPLIQLTKSMTGNADEDGSGDVSVGDTLSYEFFVENLGTVTLDPVVVVDPLVGPVSCPATSLSPGASTTCTVSHVVTNADADAAYIVNTATATGTDPTGTPVTDDDTVTTPVAQNPAITLVKTLLANADEDGSGGVSINDTLTYQFVATNDGDVTLAGVRITDPMDGLSSLSCVPGQPATLAPGESITCSADYSVTQTNVDQGQIQNTATAAGFDPSGGPVSAIDDEIILISQTASIILNKTLAGNADEDGSGGVSLDDTLTFQFTATNTGNVTLTGVIVSDPLVGLGALVCTPAQPAVLFPGDSTTCTADYVVTQADVDAAGFSNTATVDALDPGGSPVSDDDTVVTPIEGNPSIAIDKYLLSNADEDGTGDISLGDTLSYQFDVENTGDVSLTNVSVSDPLPGLGAISCTPAQGATLNPTETMMCSADYVVTAANTAAGQIDNTATAVGLAPAGTPTSDSDTETVFTANADLSLVKTVSDPAPNVGDTVAFTIAVTNAGADTATSVQVTDTLPGGLTYTPGSVAGGDAQDDTALPTLGWTIDSMTAGETVNLTFTARVGAPPADYTNVAEVTASDTFDPDSTPDNDDGDQSEDDEDTASLVPQQADLSLGKLVSNSTPNVGETVTFTIAVSNAGPDDATGVSVTDVVPAGYSNITAISNGGTLAGSTVTWSGLTVGAAGTSSLSFVATVDAPTGASDEYLNTVQVAAADQFDVDSTPNNDDGDQSEDDEANVAVTPQAADLELVKSVSAASPNVGDTVTFTITVTNNGPDDATGVAVEDAVPSGYSGITNISNGGTLAGAIITWTGLGVASGVPLILTFDAVVDAPAGIVDEYRNVAQVIASDQADSDSTPNNDDGDQSEDDEDDAVTTPALADVALTKAISDATPNVGDVVTFTITVSNVGPVTATGVVVEDSLPDGYSAITNISNGGVLAGSTITWSGLVVPVGAPAVLTFQATVDAPPADYGNVAQVTASDQFDPDSTPDNDDGDQSEDDEDRVAAAPQQADVSLIKTVSAPFPNVGDVVTFTITVSNVGPDTATGVGVTDVVPDGYANISSISNGGTLSGSTVTWSGLTIAPGVPVFLTFDATVEEPPRDYLNVAEVTAMDQFDPDSAPDNDDGDQSEDDEDGASILPQRADLSLVKTVSDPTPNVGDVITYSITVSNAGPDDVTGVGIVDTTLTGVSGISNISNGGTLAGSTVTWTGLTVTVGSPIVLTFDATVDAPTGAPNEYLNIAQITASDRYDPDSTPGNDDGDQSEDDEDNATIVPLQADVGLVKSVSTPVAAVGDVVTFTVTVSNAGPDTATSVAVEDVVPAGYFNITNISNGGVLAGATITWSGLTVVPGAPVALTFDATLAAPPADYLNVAEVIASDQYDPDSTPGNDDGDQSEDDEDSAATTPLVADLSLTKAVSDPSPLIGDVVTFSITVANAGPSTATSVAIDDVVPAGYSSVANISNGGTLVGSTVTWSGLTVPVGAPVVVTFDATVDAPTGVADEYENVAEVTASVEFDPDSTPGNDDGDQSEDDEDTATVTPQAADLSLAKTISDATPQVGDLVTYSITVTNAGPFEATGVSVADTIPSGVSSITNVSNGGTLVGSTITWSGLTVPVGAPVVVTFDATVDAPTGVGDEYENVAEVTASDQLDPDSTPDNDDGDQSEDDEDGISFVPQVADLSLVKAISNTSPLVGQVVTFTVTVNNAGPAAATGVAVEDVVPAGYFNIANISNGGVLVGSAVTWTGLTVPAASSINLSFDVTVGAPPADYVNVAEVTASDQFDPDSTPGNDDGDQSEDDEDNVGLVPQVADLELVKALSDATPNVGDVVTFTITVTNAGPDDATGVAVEDVVPAGYSGISNISNGGTLVGSTVTWSGLAVPNSDSITLTFDATVDAPTGGAVEYLNIAEVTASDQFDPDSTPGNDDGDQSEDDEDNVGLVPQVADLELVKAVSDATPNVGDVVTFTITVTNAGPDDATGVAVEDVVPAGFSNVSSISNGGAMAGSTITWSGLSVAITAPLVLTFSATVEAPTGGADDYLNVAEVTASDQFDPDSTPGNDDGDQSEDDEDNAAVTPQSADLSLTKTVSVAAPNVGDVVTFTVAVTNVGPDDATGVAVEDVLPAGYFNISNVSNGGVLAGSTITWTGLTVTNGTSINLTFDATVAAPPADYLNVAEVTASDQFDPDSTPGNDDGDQSEDDEDNAAVIPQSADLSLTKTVSVAAPNVGDVVTFTVTVGNAGPDTATSVGVEDVVPAGYSSIANVSNGGTVAGSTITWSGLTVAAGVPVALTFEATVEPPTGGAGEYANVAEVTASDQFDPDSTPGNDDGDQSEDDEDAASIAPTSADLSLSKVVSNSTPVIGDVVTFTVTVNNGGPDDATGVAVQDVVPAGYSTIANISNGGTLLASTVTWTGLVVPASGSINLTFDATVGAPPADYVNVAEVTASDQFDPDSAPGNDDGDQSEDDEDDAAVSPAVIGLAKAVSGVVNNGDGTYAVTYLLTVENLGGVTVSELAIYDDVVTQFTAISPTGFTAIDGTLTANLAWAGTSASNILAPGQSLDGGELGTVQISFTVTPGADPGPHNNTATVVGTTPSGGTVSDDSTVGVDPDPDGDGIPVEGTPTPVSFDESPSIGIAKDVTAGPTSNGDGSFDVAYTLVVENTGDVALTGIQVQDDLATTFAAAQAWSVVAVSSAAFATSASFDGATDIDVLAGSDSLGVGATGTIDITVVVTPGAELGPYWNSATATGTSPAGTTVGDTSQNGPDVDPDGNGNPTDNSDPTPVVFDQLGNVTGTIWADDDADGVIDPTESGIGGVTVELIDVGPDGIVGTGDDSIVGSTITNPDGTYEFIDVPAGEYVVAVDPATLPVGVRPTFDPDGVLDDLTAVTVNPGETTEDIDFGYVGGFNLVLTKTASVDPHPNEPLDYTLTITNQGPATAFGPITVTDNVPAALNITGVSAPGWTCTTTNQMVECLLAGDLAAGATATVTIHTIVTGSPGDEITNTAAVVVTGPVGEPDVTDNVDSVMITIGQLPRTGAELARIVVVGLLLLGAGLLLVAVTRRREEKESAHSAR